MDYSKKNFSKTSLDKISAILFNALIEIQVSPHAYGCGLREGSICDCYISIAKKAIDTAKEIVNANK